VCATWTTDSLRVMRLKHSTATDGSTHNCPSGWPQASTGIRLSATTAELAAQMPSLWERTGSCVAAKPARTTPTYKIRGATRCTETATREATPQTATEGTEQIGRCQDLEAQARAPNARGASQTLPIMLQISGKP
jgi:hypothetical protein